MRRCIAHVAGATPYGLALLLLATLVACSPRELGSYAELASPDGGLPAQPDGPDGALQQGEDAGAGDAANEQGGERDGETKLVPVPDDMADSAPPGCADAGDCDDGDSCNGVHACVEGRCELVAPACENPDAVHCDVRCDPADPAATCLVLAKDVDRDGHTAAACLEAAVAGDDCNDVDPAITPEARELCDGVDNDCDGLVDLEDGFALAGTNRKVASGMLPVLASSTENTFGAAYANSGGKVSFHSFTHLGQDLLGAIQIVPMDVFSQQVVPSLAWGTNTFGLAWSRNGAVRFLELGYTGVPVDPEAARNQEKLNVNPDGVFAGWANVTPVSGGDWLVIYDSGSPAQLSTRRIHPMGEPFEPATVVSGVFTQAVAAASVEGRGAVAWMRREGSSDMLEWTHEPETLGSPAQSIALLQTSTGLATVASPVVAVGPQGYGVAWSETASSGGGLALRFAEFDAAGTPRCEPFDVERAEQQGRSALVPTAMVATERGYLIAGFTIAGQALSIDLVEVATGQGLCRYNQRAQVATGTSKHIAMARAQTGEFLLLWDQSDDNFPYVYKRSLTADLCAPVAPP